MRTWRSENFFSSSRVRLNIVINHRVKMARRGGKRHIPLLNSMETLQKRYRHENDDGFLAVADFNLSSQVHISVL